MTFNSPLFAAFLLISFALYYVIPGRFRIWILLLCSILFYGIISLQTIAIPFILMLLAFSSGIIISKSSGNKKRMLFWGTLLVIVGTLVFFKTGFLWKDAHGIKPDLFIDPASQFIVPLGISYVTFQLLGYLIDIYRFNSRPEKNLLFFANYIFFFPKIISGPIERASDFLPQLLQEKKFVYTDITYGLKLFAVGLFKKMVIADRLSIQIDQLVGTGSGTHGVIIIAGILFIAIQIYADLSGYTDMAIGIARIFGYRLSQNFRRPFFAKSTTEFWRRWHISLSSWFNYYVFTPLSIQLRNIQTAGIVLAIITTFVLIGFWHGMAIGYVAFGLFQGVVISIELVSLKRRKKLKIKYPRLASVSGTGITALLFCVSCSVFRLKTPEQVVELCSRINLPLEIHFSRFETALALLSIAVLFFYDYFQTRMDPVEYISRKPGIIRWATYLIVLSIIIYFGYWSQNTSVYRLF